MIGICSVAPIGWFEVLDIHEELLKLGVRDTLITPEEGVELMGLSARDDIVVGWSLKRKLPLYVIDIAKAIVKSRPHVVHVHYEYSLFGSRFKGMFFPVLLMLIRLLNRAPIIITLHTIIPLDDKSLIKYKSLDSARLLARLPVPLFRLLLRAMVRLIDALSDKLIVGNKLGRDVLTEHYGVAEDRIAVIPFQAVKLYKLADVGEVCDHEGEKLVVSYGTVRKDKGFELLIKAFSDVIEQVPNARLIIIGSVRPHQTTWAYLNKLVRLARELGVEKNVSFICSTFVSTDKLHKVFRKASVFCFPYDEKMVIGSSGAVAEVITLGKPIVLTKTLMLLEYKDLEGILVFYTSRKRLSNTLISVLRDLDRIRDRISSSDVNYFIRHRMPKAIAEKLVKLYIDLLKRRAR